MTKADYTLADSPEGEDFPWCDLFHARRYFRLHLRGNDRYFTLRSSAGGEVMATIHLSETEPGHFRSPSRATYGGPAFATGAEDTLEPLMEMVCKKLRSEGATEISVVCPPHGHRPERISNLWKTLEKLGFEAHNVEKNHIISVDEDDLSAKMAHNNRKRLKKCERDGFVFAASNSPRRVYDVIVNNRQSRGYNLSMTWKGMQEMISEFPKNIEFYEASNGREIAAGAICLILNPSTLYTLFWGHMPEFDSHSPVAMLANGIYNRCREGGFRLMDLGASPHKQKGLIRFKERLGAESSEKRTYGIKF